MYTITEVVPGAAVTDVQVEFVNSYEAAGTSLTFSGTKYYNGADREFSFELYKADSNFTMEAN